MAKASIVHLQPVCRFKGRPNIGRYWKGTAISSQFALAGIRFTVDSLRIPSLSSENILMALNPSCICWTRCILSLNETGPDDALKLFVIDFTAAITIIFSLNMDGQESTFLAPAVRYPKSSYFTEMGEHSLTEDTFPKSKQFVGAFLHYISHNSNKKPMLPGIVS